MTKLELRDISSPDVEPDKWEPERNSVFILVELEVGALGEPGADTFSVLIATPEGLAARAPASDGDGTLSKRAMIVVKHFAWKALRKTLLEILRQCAGETWV